jgi:hypothetical protein
MRYNTDMRMRVVGIIVGLACLVVLPGCLYIMAAKLALKAASTVVHAARDTPAQQEMDVPQNQNALLNSYIDCLRQRNANPAMNCSQYQMALQQRTP